MKFTILVLALAAASVHAASYKDEVLADNPTGYWRLAEDTPPPTAVVAVNQGNQGSLVNGVFLGGVTLGRPGALVNDPNTAAAFTAAAGGNVEIPYSPRLNPAFKLTVELWARAGGGRGNRCVFSSLSTSGGTYGYALQLTEEGRWQFRTGLGGLSTAYNAVTGPVAQTNVWTYLVGTYENTANGPFTTLWVNGEFIDSVKGLADMNYGLVPQRIGAASAGQGTPVGFFDGGIDEVAVYEKVLGPGEIVAHHQAGVAGDGYFALVKSADPAGYWRLGEAPANPPTLATNIGSLGEMGNGLFLDGAVGGQPSALLTDPANASAGFDGLDDKVQTPFNPALNHPVFSAECWARAASSVAGRAAAVVNSREVTIATGARGFELGQTAAGWWRFWGGTGGDLGSPGLLGPATETGHWTYLLGTFDGEYLRFYVDGVLVNLQRSAMRPNTTQPFRMGGGATEDPLGADFFAGEVDEVAIYTNALPQERVLAHFVSSGREPAALAPTIVEEPVSSTNYLGEPVRFTVAATGSLPLRYRWRFNDVAIPGATNMSLVIDAVQLVQEGRYSAVVENPVGSRFSYNAKLTVLPEGLPVITQQPQPTTNFVGGTARFLVMASGSTNLLYQWHLDGVALADRTNATLVVTNVQPVSQGFYTVRVTTGRGSTVSEPARLTVISLPSESYAGVVMASQPVAYWRLDETSGYVAHDYAGGFNAEIWGNLVLGEPGAIFGSPETAFGFVAAYQSYVVAPPALELAPAPFTVQAWAKPTSVGGSEGAVVGALNHVPPQGFRLGISPAGRWEFHTGGPGGVEAFTGPRAEVGRWTQLVGTWDGETKRFYVDGAQIISRRAGYIPNPGTPVRIGAARTETGLITGFFDGVIDEVAVYSRALTSDEVLDQFGAAVGVTLPPTIVLQPQSQAVFPFSAVTFQAVAVGSPPMRYQWQFNSQDLPARTNASFTITNANASNTGLYRVIVRNPAATVTSTDASLEVVSSLPDQSYAATVLGDGATAYWRLDEPSGKVAHDTAGPNPGAYVNGVVLGDPGVIVSNSAAFFVQAGRTYMQVPYAVRLNPAEFTIEAWAKATRGAGTTRTVVGSSDESTSQGYSILAGPDDSWQLWLGCGASSGWDLIPGPLLQRETWEHLVGTSDGQTHRFYVNGVLIGVSQAPFRPNAAAPFLLGGDELSGGGTQFHFEGDLDEVALYAAPLTPTQVLVHYGLATGADGAPTLSIDHPGANVVITWSNGVLQEAAGVTGVYTNSPGTSPKTVIPGGQAKFYRVRQ